MANGSWLGSGRIVAEEMVKLTPLVLTILVVFGGMLSPAHAQGAQNPLPKRIYLSAAAAEGGDGRSWQTAFRELSQALASSAEGDTIWMAYTPGNTYVVEEISVSHTVSILGGFRVGDVSLSQRDAVQNKTSVSVWGEYGILIELTNAMYVVIDGIYFLGGQHQSTTGIRIIDSESARPGFVRILNCSFRDCENRALLHESRMPLYVHNCTFYHNSVPQYGGGAICISPYFDGDRFTVDICNVLFYENEADSGGAIYTSNRSGDDIRIINCTFRKNSAAVGNAVLVGNNSQWTVKNSILWENGTNPANAVHREHGTVRWSYCDIQGSTVWPAHYGDSLTGIIDTDPLFTKECENNRPHDGVYTYQLSPYSPVIDRGDPFSDTTGWSKDLYGAPRIRWGRIDMGAVESPYPRVKRYHVDGRKQNSGDGLSWSSAFNSLQSALEAARDGDSIWIAKGVYVPSSDPLDRGVAFEISNSISLFGGFQGFETHLSQRDLLFLDSTILSGDIDHNDVWNNGRLSNTDHNSFNVLRFGSVIQTRTVLLDGLVFQGASGGSALAIADPGSISLRQCLLRDNTGMRAGGIEFYGHGSLTLERCRFTHNSGGSSGAIYQSARDPGFTSMIRMSNCLFSNNSSTSTGVLECSGGYAVVRALNCTFADNQSEHSSTFSFNMGSTGEFRNCVFWNRSGPLAGISNIVASITVTYSTVQAGHYGTGNTLADPLFALAGSRPYELRAGSPAIDAGDPLTDTTGLGVDLGGHPRIAFGRVDMGAYEGQTRLPNTPVLLSTLDRIVVQLGDTLLLDLNRINEDGSGHYVRYEGGPIGNLRWQAIVDPIPVSISVVSSHILRISPAPESRPVASYTFKLRVHPLELPQLSAEKIMTIEVVNPGFDIRNFVMTQSQTGVISGSFESRRNTSAVGIAGNRVFLFDGESGTHLMHYILLDSVFQERAPLSMGGEQEYGSCSFRLNPGNTTVYAPGGAVDGFLDGWAKRSPYYVKHRQLRFVAPLISNPHPIQNKYAEMAADFEGPCTRLSVDSTTVSVARIRWPAFSESLKMLRIGAIALGEDAPAARGVELRTDSVVPTSFVFDSLQDSRTYRFALVASDSRGNLCESEVVAATPSGRYTLAGRVSGQYVGSSPLSVALSTLDSAGKETEIATRTVNAAMEYQFTNVTNGLYRLRVRAEGYTTAPLYADVRVLRSNRDGIDFVLAPNKLMETDGMIVTQQEGTGDLVLFARTNRLFPGEEPAEVTLKWQGGIPISHTDSATFAVTEYVTVAADAQGGVVWRFSISRDSIASKVLGRTRSFDERVRYIDARLTTKTLDYLVFRAGIWSYPLSNEKRVLFASQTFKQPAQPVVTRPVMSIRQASYSVFNTSPGAGITAHCRLVRKDGSGTPVDTVYQEVDLRNTSVDRLPQSAEEIVIRAFDWRYATSSTVGSQGHHLVSGIHGDSVLGVSLTSGRANGREASTAEWLIEVPSSGTYSVYCYVADMESRAATIALNLGSETRVSKVLQKGGLFPSYKQPGWYLLTNNVPLNRGRTTLILRAPDSAIALSGVCIARGIMPGSALLRMTPPFGTGSLSAAVSSPNLMVNTDYDLEVVLRDRFGNESDPARFTNLRTLDDYFDGQITMHQEDTTGDLVVSVQPLPLPYIRTYTVIDSFVVNLGGGRYPLPVNAPLYRDESVTIRLPRASLPSQLRENPLFQRRTRYHGAELILSRYDTLMIDRGYVYPSAGGCSGCQISCEAGVGICSCTGETRFPLFGFPVGICRHTLIDTLLRKVSSQPFRVNWPGPMDPEVAAQEYRPVTLPAITPDTVGARTIALRCTNLNESVGGEVKEQLSGTLKVTWKPGSLCRDSSEVIIPFGNRFVPVNRWIAFMPSFEGALNSSIGRRRQSGEGSPDVRHQWLDRIESTDPFLGGGFYPNTGDSVSYAEITSGDLNGVPTISMGIRLSSEECSRNGTDAEKFRLWVLPADVNGATSRYFYWGVDGVPITSSMGDAYHAGGSAQWMPGPWVTLDSGDHTIDLFMRDDGVKIAGIALSKESGQPTILVDDLRRWGSTGFDLAVSARDLSAGTKHTFTFRATDRKGNVSVTRFDTTTASAVDPVPQVVITPAEPLQNGFYHSTAPSFTLTLDRASRDSIGLEVRLVLFDGGDSTTLASPVITRNDTAPIWQAAASLDEFPVNVDLSASNCYELLARAFRGVELGDWTRLRFGVRGDGSSPTPGVVLGNPFYELPPHLRFRFERGVMTADGRVRGDLEVLFDPASAPEQRLFIEGALIEILTVDGVSSVHSFTGGTFAAYDDIGGHSRVSHLRMPYGRYTLEAPVDRMSLSNVSSTTKIAAPGMRILDDQGNPARVSALQEGFGVVGLTYQGVIDNFYCTQDNFFIEGAHRFSSVYSGFNIISCKTSFTRMDPGSAGERFAMATAGECHGCGPILDFAVLSPVYADSEFTMHTKLRDPVQVSYTAHEKAYSIAFSGPNPLQLSTPADVRYRQWEMRIRNAEFTAQGVYLTGLDVRVPRELFPDSMNSGDGMIVGIDTLLITGIENLNAGALHLQGTGNASGEGVRLVTSNEYVFQRAPRFSFAPTDNGQDYVVLLPEGGVLSCPAYRNLQFNESNNTVRDDDTIHTVISEFELRANGLSRLAAQGNFNRSLGRISRDTVGMSIRATIDVSFAARDFQLTISPRVMGTMERPDTLPLLTFSKGFFTGDVDSVPVRAASMSLFSDFSINTLYGKNDNMNGKPLTISDNRLGMAMTIHVSGIDVVNTTDGVRVLILDPELDIFKACSVQSDNGEKFLKIYNAAFDCNRQVAAVNGSIKIPESLKEVAAPLARVLSSIGSFDLERLLVGLKRSSQDTTFLLGGSATFTLGRAFKNIGLEGDKIILDALRFARSKKREEWSLDTLSARVLPLPKRFGIGPRNLFDQTPNDKTPEKEKIARDFKQDVKYVEFSSGGNGLSAKYSSETSALSLELNNWTMQVTEHFPIEALRGVSFHLERFQYQRVLDGTEKHGKITAFSASAKYRPENGRLAIGDVGLEDVLISLGYDGDLRNADFNDKSENTTSNNAYIAVRFEKVRIGDSLYNTSGGVRVYFDGSYAFDLTITFKNRIAIVPWQDTKNAQIYIDPPAQGSQLSISIKSNEGVIAQLKNVRLLSSENIPGLDTRLDVGIDSLRMTFSQGKPAVTDFAASWVLGKKWDVGGAVEIGLDTVKFGYQAAPQVIPGFAGLSDSNTFWLSVVPSVRYALGKTCSSKADGSIGILANTRKVKSLRDLTVLWNARAKIDCEVAGFGFGAKLSFSKDRIGFDTGYVNMNSLGDYGVINEKDIDRKSAIHPADAKIGIAFVGVYWHKENDKWVFKGCREVVPTFNTEKGFDVLGFYVTGELVLDRLFQKNPGIGYRKIRLRLNDNLGGAEIPTGMNLYLDGKKPFLHAEYDGPQKMTVPIPKIQLTKDITIGDVLLEFGMEKPEVLDYEVWYLRGRGSMKIPGFADNMTVDVAFEKPHPWENITGIRHAKVTIQLAPSCRIPLGSTPFYISGFFGALYDGSGQPEGVEACNIPALPPGLKLEAAVFIEFQTPNTVDGKIGVWVQLNRLNFGINGEVKAIRGIVTGDACAALYNSGRNFHGHFQVLAELGVSLKGKFVVDIWTDGSGGNFAAEASAAIGLNRGSLHDGRLIKIPSKTSWFADLFTRMGRFTNNQSGFTTGVRVVGQTFGLGVIGGSFKVGNMGSYQLKRPQGVMLRTAALRKSSSFDSHVDIDPRMRLQGGEVISIVAAVDNMHDWTGNEILVQYYDPVVGWTYDLNEAHYISPHSRGVDTGRVYEEENFNMLSRVYVNKAGYESIRFMVPPPSGIDFEYAIFTGLMPAKAIIEAAARTQGTTVTGISFNGKVANFQGVTRSIIQGEGTPEAQLLIKQKMALRLYYVPQTPGVYAGSYPADYQGGLIEIPFQQFEGWQPNHRSLLDNPAVRLDGDTLRVSNLVWKTEHAPSGVLSFRSAVELLDFITQDENGRKIELPDTDEDKAGRLREDPRVLKTAAGDPLVVTIKNNRPIRPIVGLTGTGSQVASNWQGEDETRSLFLRWKQDYHPQLAGYRVRWYPHGKPDLAREQTVGVVNQIRIDIPEITDQMYVEDCSQATPITRYVKTAANEDSLIVERPARVCGEALAIDYYRAAAYDAVVTPLVHRVVYDSLRRGEGFTPRMDTLIQLALVDSLSDTLRSIALGTNAGVPDSNLLKIALSRNGQPFGSGDTVVVGLSESAELDATIDITRPNVKVTSSSYGELFARVVAFNGSRQAVDTMAIRLPSVGARGYYFDIDSSSVQNGISITPNDRDYRCKDVFGFSCRKHVLNSEGKKTDSLVECGSCVTCPNPEDSSEVCDPNSPRNRLPRVDPCNGNPDSLMRGITPFGTYTVYVYAINNGLRAHPVAGTQAAGAVYDSFLVRVAPPRPIVHEVKPGYVLASRNNTVQLWVSNLWKSTNAVEKPVVRMRLYDKNGAFVQEETVDSYTLTARERADSSTNAEYKLVMSIANQGPKIQNEGYIVMTLLNRDVQEGRTVWSESNEMRVGYVYNTDTIQCPQFYSSDDPNARYVMKWLGNYPKQPKVGDTMTVYWSELHNWNPENYEVKLNQYVDENSSVLVSSISIPAESLLVDENGIRFRLPPQVMATGVRKWELITRPQSDYHKDICWRNWGSGYRFSIRPSPCEKVRISGHTITLTDSCNNGLWSGFRYYYFLGKDPTTFPIQPLTKYSDSIVVTHCNWLTIIRTDANGGNRTIIFSDWVCDNSRPQLAAPSGDLLPSHFTAEPGDTVIIRNTNPAILDRNQPVQYHCYTLGNGAFVCLSDTIILGITSSGPLTIQRWYRDVNSALPRRAGSSQYVVSIRAPESAQAISIPASRILDATSETVYGYPLLLRLDSSLVSGWDSAMTKGFHFRNSAMRLIPHQVESVDWAAMRMSVWVRLDSLSAVSGVNALYFVPGKPSTLSESSVWSDYTAVWHGSVNGLLMDASGNNRTMGTYGSLVTSRGVAATGDSVIGNTPPTLSDNMPLTLNDNGFTLSGWTYVPSFTAIPSQGVRLFSFKNRGGSETAALGIHADGRVFVVVNNDTLRTISGVIEEKTWLHIGTTYSWFGANDRTTIYVNGLEVASGRINRGQRVDFDRLGTFQVAGTSGNRFPGLVDELRVAPRALSASWFALDYASQRLRNDFLRPPRGVSQISAVSMAGCRISPAASDDEPLCADNRQWTLKSLPEQFMDRTWITSPLVSGISEADTLIKVSLDGPARVGLLVQAGANALIPAGFTSTGQQAAFLDNKTSTLVYFDVYDRSITGASTVWLPGPRSGGGSSTFLPYALLIDLRHTPAEVVVAARGRGVKVVQRCASGELFYSDREDEIVSLPPELGEGVLIRTPNAFRRDTSPIALSFSVDQRSELNILVDTTTSVLPSFIHDQGWRWENLLITTGKRTYRVYRRTVESGMVTLPGSGTPGQGVSTGAYGVLVKRSRNECVVQNLSPSTYTTVCQGLDTGMVIYADTSWRITALSVGLRGAALIRTRQADFAKAARGVVSFELAQGAWIYCVLDENQTGLPLFMQQDTDSTGFWEYKAYTFESNAPARYVTWRKYFKPGKVVLDGARSGGSTNNRFNYALLVQPFAPVVDIDCNGCRIIAPNESQQPFGNRQEEIVQRPLQTQGSYILQVPSRVDRCQNVSFTLNTPALVYLGIDSRYQTANSFLLRDGWSETGTNLRLEGSLPRFTVWSRDFEPGLVTIPGIQCDGIQPGLFNYIVMISPFAPKLKGYRAENLAVRGFGGERSARSENFTARNLDLSYAYAHNVQSQSWRMRIDMRGGRLTRADTTMVLSAFTDTVISVGDTSFIVITDTVKLSDLMPVFVNADSVRVNAIDLTAQGVVRVAFTNRSDVPVVGEFSVVLFEDRNGDFHYDRSVDRFLGRARVRGIDAHEYQVYEIPVNDTLSFPERVLFAFIDADNWVEESNEWNNIAHSDNGCGDSEPFSYVSDWDWHSDTALAAMIPFDAEPVVAWLVDNTRDSIVDDRDTLALVYVSGARLHAINTQTRDSLFVPFYINGLDNTDLVIRDLDGDGKPEILVGSVVYRNDGSLFWDATNWSASVPERLLDLDQDGKADSIEIRDSMVVIRSGADRKLLYANPFHRWTGPQDAVSTGVLAHVTQSERTCYDVSISFPRFAAVSGDTADVTVRVANAGNGVLSAGLKVGVYRVAADSSQTLLGMLVTTSDLGAGAFVDMRLENIPLSPVSGTALRFRGDVENRYREKNEENNQVDLWFR